MTKTETNKRVERLGEGGIAPRPQPAKRPAPVRARGLSRVCLAALAAVFALSAGPSELAAQDIPDAGATRDFAVHDLLVLEGSIFSSGFSGRDRFTSTLPRSMAGRRTASDDRERPMPLGIITFEGKPASRVDVLLEHSGTAVASIPPANVRKGRLLWSSLDLEPDAPSLPIFEGSWLKPVLTAAEEDESALIAVRGTTGLPALVYDVEVSGQPDVALRVEGEDLEATNAGRRGVTNVAVFRPAGEGRWQLGRSADLPPAPDKVEKTDETPGEDPAAGETSKDKVEAANKDAADKAAGGGLIGGLIRMAVGRPATAPADRMPVKANEQKRPDDAPVSAAKVTFSDAVTAEEAASHFVDSLPDVSDAGRAYLTALLASRVSADHSLLIYRLDPAEHTRLFPLEVTPAATQVSRVALVLIEDADPTVVERIDSLIEQLGAAQWSQRYTAHRELHRLGRVAEPKLQAAKKNKDPEIADRATRLLTEIDKPLEEPPAAPMAVQFF